MGKRASRAMEASRSPEALSVGVGITAPPPPPPPAPADSASASPFWCSEGRPDQLPTCSCTLDRPWPPHLPSCSVRHHQTCRSSSPSSRTWRRGKEKQGLNRQKRNLTLSTIPRGIQTKRIGGQKAYRPRKWLPGNEHSTKEQMGTGKHGRSPQRGFSSRPYRSGSSCMVA